MVSEQGVKLTSWVGMAPKKNRKQPQGSMLEEPAEDLVAPPESIGEEEPRPREDQDCRAPKFLVDPLEGPSMRQCGSGWTFGHDPDF